MTEINILRDIEEREKQISALNEEITALRKVAEIYGLTANPKKKSAVEGDSLASFKNLVETNGTANNSQKAKFGASKFHKPIGDAVVEMLKQEENGLHLDEILKRLEADDITPTWNSLDAALRKDTKKRFKLVGVRTYGLNKNLDGNQPS